MNSLVWLVLISAIQFTVQANAEVLKGGNTTFFVGGLYGDNKTVTIDRGNGKKEVITITPDDTRGGWGLFAMDVSAMNAYLNSGKELDVPSKFKNAEEFLNFASSKKEKIEGTITDSTARNYIRNLRMDGITYIDELSKCEAIQASQKSKKSQSTDEPSSKR